MYRIEHYLSPAVLIDVGHLTAVLLSSFIIRDATAPGRSVPKGGRFSSSTRIGMSGFELINSEAYHWPFSQHGLRILF